MPKPKGYNVITLSDQINCERIFDGQGWRLLQHFKAGQARQFRDMVGRTLLLVTASGQGIMAFSWIESSLRSPTALLDLDQEA